MSFETNTNNPYSETSDGCFADLGKTRLGLRPDPCKARLELDSDPCKARLGLRPDPGNRRPLASSVPSGGFRPFYSGSNIGAKSCRTQTRFIRANQITFTPTNSPVRVEPERCDRQQNMSSPFGGTSTNTQKSIFHSLLEKFDTLDTDSQHIIPHPMDRFKKIFR
ncbi:MAG: hypothetical protein JKX76_01460 [Colwellia sp.]|nr:hypothetical protein [Colwellia sp.]